jgi:hypothetical protein
MLFTLAHDLPDAELAWLLEQDHLLELHYEAEARTLAALASDEVASEPFIP